jgi:N-methylhydantoinase B
MHWIDIGGSVPRSTDIFMEGLQFRSIKLRSKGEPIEEVYRIIENNTRFPAQLMGDIGAQLSGCLAGRDLVAGLAAKYGVATFRRAVDTMLDQSEASRRGAYRAERLHLAAGSRSRNLRASAAQRRRSRRLLRWPSNDSWSEP